MIKEVLDIYMNEPNKLDVKYVHVIPVDWGSSKYFDIKDERGKIWNLKRFTKYDMMAEDVYLDKFFDCTKIELCEYDPDDYMDIIKKMNKDRREKALETDSKWVVKIYCELKQNKKKEKQERK